jgi:phosphate transport system protein
MANEHIVKSYDEDIALLTRQIIEMGGLIEHQLKQAIKALVERDANLAARVIERDDEVDQQEEDIDKHVIRLLATRQPMAVDLRLVAMAMRISNDLERIGDYAVNISKRTINLAKTSPVQSLSTIPHMAQLAQSMLSDVLDAYVQRDVAKAVAVWHRDSELDALYNSLFRELATYMLEDPRSISSCIDLLFVARHIERIGDRAGNIAEKIHYMIHGERINRMPALAVE